MAAERVALVIGNAKYADAALKNPANDADAVAAALKKLDFQVTQKTDLELAQFEDAVIGIEANYTRFNVKAGNSTAALTRTIANPDGAKPPPGHSYEYDVTLSGTGQLVALDWGEPGLPLAYEA